MAYRILDSHVHFWDPVARHHEWLVEVPHLNRRFGPDDYDAGRHELGGFVFVQADCRDEEALAEARWVAELAATFPLIRGIVAYAPLQRGRAAESHLDALADEPLVVGVRRLLQDRPVEEITEAAFIEGVQRLASGISASTSASGTRSCPLLPTLWRHAPTRTSSSTTSVSRRSPMARSTHGAST